MKYLTVDFGSTYTKLTAIDSVRAEVLATAQSFTTIETNVLDGFRAAMSKLNAALGYTFEYDEMLCCSSAAGGLKMVALGLVPELTAKAARMAASSAGAKVMKTYAFEISAKEQQEIYDTNPDLVLLCGGTDGGNKEVITANAKRLAGIDRCFAVIVAGNKNATEEIDAILARSGKDYVITDNVMPNFNEVCIEPAKEQIKNLFIRKIVEAKGLTEAQNMTPHKIIPTPLAVMNGCELFSKGSKNLPGHGDMMAIDIGGATTDVYSMATGEPTLEATMIKGLPEPYSKRTVEGDLGMRYSLRHVAEAIDMARIERETGIPGADILAWVDCCTQAPDTIATKGSREEKIEEALGRAAVSLAVQRHCGVLTTIYSPMGQFYSLTGKDLMDTPFVIGIGGVIINSNHPKDILSGAQYDINHAESAKPKKPKYMIDARYIFAAMGLLSTVDADLALTILNKEIKNI